MNKFAVLSICVVLAAPAIFVEDARAESVSEKSGVNSVLGISPSTADFVTEAAINGMFEIQSSQLAAPKVDALTKAFAELMIADHEKTLSELKSMVQSGEVKAELPYQLDSLHQSMLDTLKGLDGADFARQYHDVQDTGHMDAVSLFRRYAKGGDNPALKAWAAKTLPTLEDHLKSAETLDKQH